MLGRVLRLPLNLHQRRVVCMASMGPEQASVGQALLDVLSRVQQASLRAGRSQPVRSY